MFCTDVAARGLDLPAVDWIMQYDPPNETTEYVHRGETTERVRASGSVALGGLLPCPPTRLIVRRRDVMAGWLTVVAVVLIGSGADGAQRTAGQCTPLPLAIGAGILGCAQRPWHHPCPSSLTGHPCVLYPSTLRQVQSTRGGR